MSFKKMISVLITLTMIVSIVPVFAVYNEEVHEETADLSQDLLPYEDTSLSFEERAADLVSRMTLEEKVTQVGNGASKIERLGVSGYQYWREALHGVARQGVATSFPTSLSMSNTWDLDLIFECADITSTEARGKNNKTDLSYWSPTINMARDPRWGRNEETYGEDPYLTTMIGGQFVEGMQGNDEKYLKTISTLKHFAANNNEAERARGTSVMNEKTLREYYTRAFRDIVETNNVASIMSSYNAITLNSNGNQILDYRPSAANEYLLTDLLRRTWGFSGYVTGDCGGVGNLYSKEQYRQKLFPDLKTSEITNAMTVAESFKAGNDIDCGSEAITYTYDSVKNGYLDEDTLDLNLYRLFLQRMRTGEFDNGASPYSNIGKDVIEKEEHVAKAEEAAEKSWVLLKNDDNVLPLKQSTTNVALVGGLADAVTLGDYSGEPTKKTTPYEGITDEVKALNPDAQVNYLGKVSDTTPLFNMKSIKLVLEDGTERAVDLSKATNVRGMTQTGGEFKDITKKGSAVIKDVDFTDVVEVKVEAASKPGMPTTAVQIGYNTEAHTVSTIPVVSTSSENDYKENTGGYMVGGGYNEKADLYLSVTANADFSVANYKEALDAADVIIAYSGTSEADSGEYTDRSNIELPNSQSHVMQLCNSYPEKTVVVLSSVGQLNVEPFVNKCKALLWTSYNGQTQGTAIGKVLTGAVNPSGKLSTTWYTAADVNNMQIKPTSKSEGGITYYSSDYEINQTGTSKGKTYQYYSGTPIYPFGYGMTYTAFDYSNIRVDKTSVDANDMIKISADIKNIGTVAGAEAVQLYVSVPGADGVTYPLKQLKGFDRVELEPGETKTVTFELILADVIFFDEAAQLNYVVNGEYTAFIAENANDTKNSVKFNVTGSLDETLKNVQVVPTGVTLYGGINYELDETSLPLNRIDAIASAAMSNDKLFMDLSKLSGATVSYSSSNEDVAIVDSNGVVKSSKQEGAALITVSVTYNGVTKTDEFPVVTKLKLKNDAASTAEYTEKLDSAYSVYLPVAYTADNWNKLTEIYNQGKVDISETILQEDLPSVFAVIIKNLSEVPTLPMVHAYSIVADNANIIKDNRIEYSETGIGNYVANEDRVMGTITVNEPRDIQLKAFKDGSEVESSKIAWSITKLDSSERVEATIDPMTGILRISENGMFKVTANNYTDFEMGSMIIYANLQIEGESAAESGGANLNDQQPGASGGKNAGSTGSSWMRYDGIKLEGLTHVTFRVAKGGSDAKVYMSLNKYPGMALASGVLSSTGSNSKWKESTIEVDEMIIDKAELDEYGFGSVYVQINDANLDYFVLHYKDSSLDVTNKKDGVISVGVPFENGVIVAAQYDEDGEILKNYSIKEFNTVGEYSFDGYKNGDTVNIFIWDGLSTLSPLVEPISHVYKAPVSENIRMWNFGDSAFNNMFDLDMGEVGVSGTGMDVTGEWQADSSQKKYTFEGKEYTFKRGFKGGLGGTHQRNVFFTPEVPGFVNVFYNSAKDRFVEAQQNGVVLGKDFGDGNDITTLSFKVEAGSPVYIYGGGSNKTIYAVAYEAYGDLPDPTETPEPTVAPTPTIRPIIVDEIKQEFEDYYEAWTERAKKTSVEHASNGYVIDYTKKNDCFYLGTYNFSNLAIIDFVVGTQATTSKAECYAIDMTGFDPSGVSKDVVLAKMTEETLIGSTGTIKSDSKDWNKFQSNEVLIDRRTGDYGLFVKLSTGDNYVGNFDYITLMYTEPSAESSEEKSDKVYTASNDNLWVSVSGDAVTVEDGHETQTYSYNEKNGENISFKAITAWENMFAAIVEDIETGQTDIITTSRGNIWTVGTPTIFESSEVNLDEYDGFIFNDLLAVKDQLYVACDDGIIITMTSCSKCTAVKRPCNFDINKLELDDEKMILIGSQRTSRISIKDARQNKIQAEAALELFENGALLVDVRSESEFMEYSFDGSINIPVDEFAEWLLKQPLDTKIIVYCGSGKRSSKALDAAIELGYTNIYDLGSVDSLVK